MNANENESRELKTLEELEQATGGFYHGESLEQKTYKLSAWKRRDLPFSMFVLTFGLNEQEKAEAAEIWDSI